MSSAPVVGFIGLGKIGTPMAANIAAAGYTMWCYDVVGIKGRLPHGAKAAESIAEIAVECDVILLSLPDGEASIAVAAAIAAALNRRVRSVVDLSTIGPIAAIAAAAPLTDAGIEYCDGPVSGGVAGARARTIALMFAGSADIYLQLQPLLQSFAGNVFHVGERVGQGQAIKLVNNFLSATALAATSEAFTFGERWGIDLATMTAVVNASSGRNTATTDKFPSRVITGTYDAGFSTAHMTKDVGLYRSGVHEIGTPSAIGDAVTDIWEAMNASMPGSDFSEIWRFVNGH